MACQSNRMLDQLTKANGVLSFKRLPAGRLQEDVSADERFDIEFLSSVKLHVVSRIGHCRVRQEHIASFVDVVRHGSRLYTISGEAAAAGRKPFENGRPDGSGDDNSHQASGTVAGVEPVMKERLAFAFLDMLFWMCSDETDGG